MPYQVLSPLKSSSVQSSILIYCKYFLEPIVFWFLVMLQGLLWHNLWLVSLRAYYCILGDSSDSF